MTRPLEPLIAEIKDKSMVTAEDFAALIAALEQTKAQSSKWLEAYHKAVSIGARYEEIIAELEATLEREREKSRRVMSRNHQLDASPTATKVTLYRDGIEAAAKFIDNQRESFDNEHGSFDSDTGSFEFGNQAALEYSDSLAELAEGVRALHPVADASEAGPLAPQLPAVPEGWVMVPRKITLEMECALSRADSYEIGWQWAIAAAPKPE